MCHHRNYVAAVVADAALAEEAASSALSFPFLCILDQLQNRYRTLNSSSPDLPGFCLLF